MAMTREEQIRAIDDRAAKDKKRWLCIMAAIMVVIAAVSAVVAVVNLAAAPAALIAAVIGLAITAKLCMEQVAKVNERHKNDLNKLDNKGHY